MTLIPGGAAGDRAAGDQRRQDLPRPDSPGQGITVLDLKQRLGSLGWHPFRGQLAIVGALSSGLHPPDSAQFDVASDGLPTHGWEQWAKRPKDLTLMQIRYRSVP